MHKQSALDEIYETLLLYSVQWLASSTPRTMNHALHDNVSHNTVVPRDRKMIHRGTVDDSPKM